MYTNVIVNISHNEKQTFKGVSIRKRLVFTTFSQRPSRRRPYSRLKKAHEAGKGITIKLPKTHVAHNMKVQGRIIPLLAGLASQAIPFLTGTVLPVLGVGALLGLAMQFWGAKTYRKWSLH